MADEVKVKITGDSKDAEKAFKKTQTASQRAFNKVKEGAKKVKTAVLASYKAIGVGVGVLIGFAGVAVKAFRTQELAINQLNQSLKTQGIFSKELSDEYQTMAAELQNVSTFGDEATISALAQLQAYAGQTKITKELTQSILDFAAAQKVDLNTAFQLVGKSVGGPTNALARYGIAIDTSGTKAEKMEAIQEALNKQFGGQAAAVADGLGSVTQMTNALGDLTEVIGKAIAPAVIRFAKGMTFLTNKFIEFLTTTSDKEEETGKKTVDFLDSQISKLEELRMKREELGNQDPTSIGAARVQQIELEIAAQERLLEQLRLGQIEKDKMNEDELKSNEDKNVKVLTAEEEKQERERALAANHLAQLQAIKDEDFERQRALAVEREELQGEERQTKHEEELARLSGELQNEEDVRRQFELQKRKAEIKERNLRLQDEKKHGKAFAAFNSALRSEEVQGVKSASNQLMALQNSKNAQLKKIGKVAALANIAINTAEGAIAAYKSLAVIPLVGPGLGIAAAAALTAYGLERANEVRKAQAGGLVPGFGSGDTVPILAEPGELIVPKAIAPTFTEAVAASGTGEGGAPFATLDLTLKGGLSEFIEVQSVERRNLNINIDAEA